MSIDAYQQESLESAAAGLFGDDDDDDEDDGNGLRHGGGGDGWGEDDDNLGLDDDDVLGLDDGGNGRHGGEADYYNDADNVDQERGLLMRFCPHDSSMLYPKVSFSVSFPHSPSSCFHNFGSRESER
jgi:hypothetical protein